MNTHLRGHRVHGGSVTACGMFSKGTKRPHLAQTEDGAAVTCKRCLRCSRMPQVPVAVEPPREQSAA